MTISMVLCAYGPMNQLIGFLFFVFLFLFLFFNMANIKIQWSPVGPIWWSWIIVGLTKCFSVSSHANIHSIFVFLSQNTMSLHGPLYQWSYKLVLVGPVVPCIDDKLFVLFFFPLPPHTTLSISRSSSA